MGAQAAMNALTGAITSAALTAVKIGEASSKKPQAGLKAPKQEKASGIDAKMAAKARKEMQQKINTIYANKELSQKALTRRVGVALDEYTKILGGKE